MPGGRGWWIWIPRLVEMAAREPYREPVGWLRCFRGIDTLTAMLILAKVHDFRRFASAAVLMAYLGLVPGEAPVGKASTWPHHSHRQRADVAVAGGNCVALSTSPERRHRADAAAQGAAGAGHCDRRQGAAPAVSALPEVGGGT